MMNSMHCGRTASKAYVCIELKETERARRARRSFSTSFCFVHLFLPYRGISPPFYLFDRYAHDCADSCLTGRAGLAGRCM